VLSGNFGGLPNKDAHIVVDGCNVAWNYGECKGFSSQGLQLCLDWFLARNFSKVVAFVPHSYCSPPDGSKRGARSSHAAKTGHYQNRADDVSALLHLHQRGLVRFTPRGGDDDAFIISFAYQSDGWIVSNDNYREFLQGAIPPAERDWLLWRKIFYTFVGNVFIPTAPKIHRKPPAHLPALGGAAGEGTGRGGSGVGVQAMPTTLEAVGVGCRQVDSEVQVELACSRHRERLEALVAIEHTVSDHQLPLPPPPYAVYNTVTQAPACGAGLLCGDKDNDKDNVFEAPVFSGPVRQLLAALFSKVSGFESSLEEARQGIRLVRREQARQQKVLSHIVELVQRSPARALKSRPRPTQVNQ
jgi:ribonuclease ZC3H12